MQCQEYYAQLKKDYDLVRRLSDKNDSLTLLLKHKTLRQNLVYRQYAASFPIYDYLATIAFDNLPLVYDVCHLEDGQIVLEEYIEGLTVAEVIENGLYTYGGAKKVIIGVCNALTVLHAQGFVHRDIKPENVMISGDGIVKLIDFNASRKIALNAQKDTVPIGTIGYASPEQLGIAQSDTKTDIYALGVLLNVMLTGNHPSKQLAKGRAGKIVLKCTQISPHSRYRTVNELMSAL